MTLRTHLLLLTLVTVLPLVMFGVGATALIADRERDIFRQGAQERTLALLTALDTELTGHLTSLRGLASSQQLANDNLEAFYLTAVRTVATQPNWVSINLALPSGERLLSTSAPFGARVPPIVERPTFERALSTGQPVIGNLVLDGGRSSIPIRLPLLREDRPSYVLSVLVDPQAILNLLSAQRLPSDWVGVVLDANRHIVARTVAHEMRLGQPASESLRAALDRSDEGWFQGSTIEGNDVYTPFNRSAATGWTVAMGIPVAAVESGAERATGLLAIGTVAASGAAFLLAMALGRRISQPIVSLSSAARALQEGAPITPPAAGGVREVNDVRLALVTASKAIREREEALRAADRAKDEFLAMLAHELRNPLAALASAVALLDLRRQDEALTTQAVGVVRRQAQHMTRLVDDLLDVSRATSGKIHLSPRPRNMADAVTAVVEGMRAAGRLDRHEIAVETAPVWVNADEVRLDQIVSNLIENAVKYTPPGGRITVRVFPREREAVFLVEDTGAGLPPELLPRVFDVFVQGDQSLDRSAGGLGIGLTLVKRLTELHGGRVTAESEGPGRGSRFTVVLGTVEPARSPAATPPVPAAAAGRRILLIEDNADARDMLRAVLELYGYIVFESADGPGGIRAVAQTKPEVVLIDLGLPGLDGFEVARAIRASPEGRSALLLALTGYGQPEARRKAMEAGFDDHLTKPVAPDRLAQIIAARFPGDHASRSQQQT